MAWRTTLLLALVATRSIAAPAASSGFTYYNLKTPLAAPCDIDTGPDGAIYADTFLSNKIVRIDPKSGVLTEYNIPYTLAPLPVPNFAALSAAQGRVAGSCVVRTGKDGKVYVATGIRNQMARIDPNTKVVEVFNTGDPVQNALGDLQPFNDGWPGETGMWFTMTTAGKLCLFDYVTTKTKCWTVPTPGSGALGVQVASDKAVWITEMLSSKIGRFDPRNETWTEYQLPATAALPTVIRVEYLGKIWFTSLAGDSQVSIDIKTKAIQVFIDDKTSPVALPNENTLDRNGRIWFSTITTNSLNTYTPTTNQFGIIYQPGTVLNVGGTSVLPNGNISMHYDNGTNSIWFAGLATNFVGKYQL
ncbi:hypothetical protein B0A48_11488 [Cryoendolithus antarcticus]|uniref:SMP-30/Gluconolactonase/LRE-like region domain-containing protein n=1 Tax=Cryoendolithus antarcticus TaxID=1507870 RepID=A0A1V8SWH7_9PEZI|nr:hypothetical protein B0A48_11488 [Cryoendolithus antarcticus]